MAKALYEPDPRVSPYSAVVNGELCVWGGTKRTTTSLEVYHPCLESWRQLLTHGSPPPGLFVGASAHSQHYLYLYGGMKADGSCSGCLHRLDTNTATWTELSGHCPGAPMKKIGCGMIVYENSVIIIGGLGIRNGPIQPGSEWRKRKPNDDDNDPTTKGHTNEMHKYDLREGTWSSVMCTGTRPPPCAYFSLTMINNHQTVLFEGKTTVPYILDLVGMNWSEIPFDGGECPVSRTGHAAVCMDYGGDKPHLLLMGGQDTNGDILNDVWMMDIKSGGWRKVPVPNLQPRCDHCAAAFCLSPGITEVVLFGGSIAWPFSRDNVIAGTTILRFESDASDPQSEWRLTDVADHTQRGTSERIREKMTKLSRLTHKAEGRAQEAKRGKEEAERRAQEAKRGKEEAERRARSREKSPSCPWG